MFALAAAVLFVIGVFAGHLHTDSYVFWLMLGLAALAVHFAYEIALPVTRSSFRR